MTLVDLDARRAQRAEAAGDPTVVRLGGEEFAFPRVTEWPIDLVDILNRGDLLGALQALLSEDDLPRFLATKPTMADINDLFDELGKAAGIGDLGNSPGSASSSSSAPKS